MTCEKSFYLISCDITHIYLFKKILDLHKTQEVLSPSPLSSSPEIHLPFHLFPSVTRVGDVEQWYRAPDRCNEGRCKYGSHLQTV